MDDLVQDICFGTEPCRVSCCQKQRLQPKIDIENKEQWH